MAPRARRPRRSCHSMSWRAQASSARADRCSAISKCSSSSAIRVRVVLYGGDREGAVCALRGVQVRYAQPSARASGACSAAINSPLLFAPVLAQFHVVGHRAELARRAGAGPAPFRPNRAVAHRAARRSLRDLGERVGGVFAEAQVPRLGGQDRPPSERLARRAESARGRSSGSSCESGCSSNAATSAGARSVANVSHQLSLGRATSSTHSSWARRPRCRAKVRASGSLTTARCAGDSRAAAPPPGRARVQRHDPGSLARIPAAARDGPQEPAQAVVVGELEHRLALLERRLEKGHDLRTIGRAGDGRVSCRRRQPLSKRDKGARSAVCFAHKLADRRSHSISDR